LREMALLRHGHARQASAAVRQNQAYCYASDRRGAREYAFTRYVDG